MTKVAICDDDKLELARTTQGISEYLKEKGENQVKIELFTNPGELLRRAKAGIIYDIYVLDIIMEPITGIELAKQLKSIKDSIKVVFTTSSKEYAIDAFELKAEHYILKPLKKDQLFEALNRVFTGNEEKFYFVKNTSKGLKKVPIDDIYFSESNGHYQYITTSTEVLKVRMKTIELWEELSQYPQFLRPHSGYIVNMNYVRAITAFGMTIKDTEIPIAKNTLNKVKHSFMEYTFKNKK